MRLARVPVGAAIMDIFDSFDVEGRSVRLA